MMYQTFQIAMFVSEFMAALFASFYFYKYNKSGVAILLLVLWYIPINEMLCQYVFPRSSTGYFLYNIYDVIVAGSILYIIATQVKQKVRRIIALFLLIACTIIFIISLFFFDPFIEFSKTNFTVFTVLVISALLTYFIDLLHSDEILHINKNLFLIVSFGFLIFFIGYPVISLAREFISEEKNVNGILNNIQFIVGILSYATIAFGFYWGEKTETNYLKNTKH